ncbi:uncharacterized protein HaLaN_12321 [Haematococcus lacustris]|uniref:Uncharacterized protein n=1 Tax=Haematococcus lacustris TaxID=44745 RepID=A0A699ZJQ6_HAELA|nr:uncharacterized protein HaLaN_12321 [Haematococcus lacustris]
MRTDCHAVHCARSALVSVEPQSAPEASGAQLEVARCGASLALCCVRQAWHCPLCARRYLDPPMVRLDGWPDSPYCVICGVRLGGSTTSGLPSPALELQPIPPEPLVIQ